MESNSASQIQALNERIQVESAFIDRILQESKRVIVGQDHMMNRLLIGLLSRGHVLLEGLPGLAKTLAIRTLSTLIDASYQRVQFTPDLLPADIIGTMIYNPAKQDFTVQKGPVFSNFILADEINRAPAKVQSALLEAMQERQVTIGKNTFALEEPFLVLATQNPIEQEGTYNLPEAQVDRFMLKVTVDYPDRAAEQEIMRLNLRGLPLGDLTTIASTAEILQARRSIQEIHMDEKIERYILDIIFATRTPDAMGMTDLAPLISYGGSPRATIALAKAAKAQAFIARRAYVIPEDVRQISLDVLRHRVGLSYEAEAENVSTDELVKRILDKIEVI